MYDIEQQAERIKRRLINNANKGIGEDTWGKRFYKVGGIANRYIHNIAKSGKAIAETRHHSDGTPYNLYDSTKQVSRRTYMGLSNG